MKPQYERSKARRQVLQIMYQHEITGEGIAEIVEQGTYSTEDGPLDDFAKLLLAGIEGHLEGIDKRISSTSENWTLSRMPAIDRNILRIACYEVLFTPDVPMSVAINEAVELAKVFGGDDDSSKFVNGILGRIAEQVVASETALSEKSASSDAVSAEAAVTETAVAEKDDVNE